jgi:hypothetical protein
VKKLLALALPLVSCSSAHITVHTAPQHLDIVGAFVYPFAFRWEEPAYRSFELSQRLVDAAVETVGDRLSFWGPSEFKVMRSDDDAAWVATTALPLLTATAARPDQGLVIRPWAEKRITSSLQEAQDAKGRRAGASSSEETVYLGHLEVVHPSTHALLFEVDGEVKVDPFAESGPEADYDPCPPLTSLMERLMRAAAKKIGGWAADRTAQPLPQVPFAFTPAAAVRWSDGARGSAELEMARMDSASLDLFLQARARFLNPKVPDLTAAKISKLNPGLYVSGPPPSGPLTEGDLLTLLDEQPAQPQVWARLRFSPQVSAKVKGPTGEVREVLLP